MNITLYARNILLDDAGKKCATILELPKSRSSSRKNPICFVHTLSTVSYDHRYT
jgi:hypothetical protein